MRRHVPQTLRLHQLQVLHRHGDRTPLRNVFKGSAPLDELEECKRWTPKLPLSEQLTQLGSTYRVKQAEGVHNPYQTRPFGYLTTTGIEQMTARGDRLRAFGESEAFPFGSLTDSNVQIFSNLYTRTQLSVQALLRGLLRSEPHLAPRVQVLAPDRDIINTYASFPEIAVLKNGLEAENEELAFRENEMAPRKQELMRMLPMFAAEGAAPFTWMAAADYFVCRSAHQIALLSGTQEHHEATVDHLSFRFHQFYSHPRILQLVAGRLMQNMLVEIQKVTDNAASMKKLVIYSGHDISILSVLHAINARLADDEKWWPEYSSAVALELLQDESSGKWFVRFRLDDDVLALRGSSSEESMYPLDEFQGLIIDKMNGFEE